RRPGSGPFPTGVIAESGFGAALSGLVGCGLFVHRLRVALGGVAATDLAAVVGFPQGGADTAAGPLEGGSPHHHADRHGGDDQQHDDKGNGKFDHGCSSPAAPRWGAKARDQRSANPSPSLTSKNSGISRASARRRASSSPITMKAVARASASAAVGMITVTEARPWRMGRPLRGSMVWENRTPSRSK